MSREQFEAWIADTTNSDLHRGIMLDRHENGRYRHLATENKWEAWQAATNALEAKCAALAADLEAAEKELSLCKSILEKIKSTSCHVDTSKGAFIPNSLDAWGRPVPQYLPYDFSGNPGASATQYCNGWNDAGGYWLNHVKYLQECISAAGIITKVGE